MMTHSSCSSMYDQRLTWPVVWIQISFASVSVPIYNKSALPTLTSNQICVYHLPMHDQHCMLGPGSLRAKSEVIRDVMHEVALQAAHEAAHEVKDLSLNVGMSLNMQCVSLQPTAPVLQSFNYCSLLPETAPGAYNMHASIHTIAN